MPHVPRTPPSKVGVRLAMPQKAPQTHHRLPSIEFAGIRFTVQVRTVSGEDDDPLTQLTARPLATALRHQRNTTRFLSSPFHFNSFHFDTIRFRFGNRLEVNRHKLDALQ